MNKGDALRAARIAANLSQQALADLARVKSRSSIAMMEAGRRPITEAVWTALGLDGPPDDVPSVSRRRVRARVTTGNRAVVVLSDEAAAIWRRWVDEGELPASDRVSRLIETAGGGEAKKKAP